MSSHPNLAIAAQLIALHFYLSGKPGASSPTDQEISASESDWTRCRGYFGYLQEVPASHPWLYLEDPAEKKKAVLGWLFFETQVSDATCGSDEESWDGLAMGRRIFQEVVGDAFTKLLRGVSSLSVPSGSGFSTSRGFSVNLPMCETRQQSGKGTLISADEVAELAIEAIQKYSPFQILRDQLVVDTYRALFQRVTPNVRESPSTDTNSNISIQVIFPQIQSATGKLRATGTVPDQLSQIQPSLSSRGEVVIGIFVSSIFAGYISLLCLSPDSSSSKTTIPSQKSPAHIPRSTLYISLLYINKDFRRMGLGRKLMEAVLDPARIADVVELAKRAVGDDVETEVSEMGGTCVDVWVTVDSGNAAAGELYESCGFVEEGRNCSVRGGWTV